jgi:hypothetical protein
MNERDVGRDELVTYRRNGTQVLRSSDGFKWEVVFTYGDTHRADELVRMLNNAAIRNFSLLLQEMGVKPRVVKHCDDCPLFDRPVTRCKHPDVKNKQMAYTAARRPDWCPLQQRPLYLLTNPAA